MKRRVSDRQKSQKRRWLQCPKSKRVAILGRYDIALRATRCEYPRVTAAFANSVRVAIHTFLEEQNGESTGDGLTTYEHRSDESNLWLRLHFCNRWATAVMLTLEKFPGVRVITGGTFDDPNWFKIDRNVWTRSAQRWVVFSAERGPL